MFDDIKEVIQSYPALAIIIMYFWIRIFKKTTQENIQEINISGHKYRQEIRAELLELNKEVSKLQGRLNGSSK